MADYRLADHGVVVRASDGASIPDDPANHDRAEYDAWLAAGGAPDPYIPPVVEPSFLARDLMAQLTPDDYGAIQAAIASSTPLGLLWASLLAQGEAPVMSSSTRFQQGWAGLKVALGDARAAAIGSAIGIPGG
jgi:hypothetical protein